MAKMTLDQLRKLREDSKLQMSRRDVAGNSIQIIIGMGTCGIAAGAKDALNSFITTLEEHKLENVTVKQSGCMGLCHAEPTVEVRVPDMPDTIYGNVDANIAKRIVEKHILKKTLINEHIFDRPAADIIRD